MNLQEFIATTIEDIVKGVNDAKNSTKEYNAKVASDTSLACVQSDKVITSVSGSQVSLIEFDIALSQENSKETKGGIGVFLGNVGLGAQGQSYGEYGSLSRVKFTVPIMLPKGKKSE